MVRHHRAGQEPHWKRRATINMIGAIATFIVLCVVVVSKFTIGAWIPVALIPIIVLGFKAIHRHYERIRVGMEVPDGYRPVARRQTVIVLCGAVNRGVLEALEYAMSLRPDRLVAATVVTNEAQEDAILDQWEQHDIPVELRVIHDPYRDLTNAVVSFLDEIDADWPDDLVTVVVPEFVLHHWWEQALHNQSALLLRAKLRYRPNTVITAVPMHFATEDTTIPGVPLQT